MLCRLRLLWRFSSPLQIPPHLPTPVQNLSSRTRRNQRSSWRRSLLCRWTTAKRGQGASAFCTQATEMEEAAGSALSAPYLSVRIRCRRDVIDMFSEALLSFGANSASMDEDENSENSAEETFLPIKVTDGLWIIPKWRSPQDLQAINITLDPGLAFGTGEHPTTKLCLLLLHDLIKGGEHFFDYGTGSGVLGIAAVKMGAAFSVGIDVDPQAVKSAHQNIALNEMDSSKMLVYLVPSKPCSIDIHRSTDKNA